LLGANIRWIAPDERWTLTIGASNLSDEKYLITGFLQPNFGIYEGLFAREREWYATVTYDF